MEMFQRVAAFFQGRSPKWPAVQRRHLKENPTCAACGRANKLNVHHLKPREYYPEMELDPANLLTLCRPCHYLIGHGGRSWREWIDGCEQLAATVFKAVAGRLTERDVTW